MLQTLREQQKPLLIVIFALIVLSFGLLINLSDTGFNFLGSDNTQARAYVGKKAVSEQGQRDLASQIEMLSRLGLVNVRPQRFGFNPQIAQEQQLIGNFLTALTVAGPTTPVSSASAARSNQILNLLAFREQAKAAGIYFNEESHRDQISRGLTRLPGLRNENTGDFDENLLETLLLSSERDSAPLNLISDDFEANQGSEPFRLSPYGDGPKAISLLRGIVADLLSFEALKEIAQPAGETTTAFIQRAESLSSAQNEILVLEGNTADFVPTEEEIDEVLLSSWYEQNSVRFNAPETRKVQLIIGKVAKEQESAEASDDLLTEDTEGLVATKVTSEAWNELFNRFSNFYNEVTATRNPTPLREAALAADLELVEIRGVSLENQPGLFADDPRLLALALNATPGTERIAPPLQEQERGRIVSLRVLEVTPPQPRPLEEVRERAIEAWKVDVSARNLEGALNDAAAAMEAQFQEQGNLADFQPEDTRLRLSQPRYLDRTRSSQMNLFSGSLLVPVGKASAVMGIPQKPAFLGQQPSELSLDDDSPKLGLAFVTARRLPQEISSRLNEIPSSGANLSQALMIDWLQQARRDQEVRAAGQ